MGGHVANKRRRFSPSVFFPAFKTSLIYLFYFFFFRISFTAWPSQHAAHSLPGVLILLSYSFGALCILS